ncbi:MAG TPA: iron uptake transporter permease EfeU [Candidatus Limnocylindrales bacterium]|nr:iron uptake transporter permease EfeU [Candidatus Limnocylindrales bacterium]
MAATFVLMLREGLEAALIVGIIAAYLVKVGRRDALPPVLAGVIGAAALAIVAGIAIVVTVGRLPIVVQESFEGGAGLAAVAVLTWMLFWMRRQGRALKGELETGVATALAAGSTGALVGLAFIAVIREGLETVLFLLAVGSAAGASAATVIGGLLGLVAAVAIGYAIFAAGVRVDLRRFFTATGTILIFVSAGLMAFAVHEFGEAGLVSNTGKLFDLNGLLPASSPLGTLLAGLFGYRAAPTPLEAIAWVAYLVPVLVLFVGVPRRRAVVAATVACLAVALIAGCSPAASGSPAASAAAPSTAATTIRVTASEYSFTPAALEASAGSVTFHVTNAGADTHEFEIFQGDQVVDEVEDIVPGISRDLTVTLAAGEYTFVCALNGHDSLGMKGTISVAAS